MSKLMPNSELERIYTVAFLAKFDLAAGQLNGGVEENQEITRTS
jgi:hypothetical protein